MTSVLEIFDLATDRAETVLESPRLIEAPNWTRDGQALIVNSDGRLFRVPLAAPKLVAIDTAPHDRLNNDHGLSPDGKTIAISDSTETGKSCIYILPASGGPPRRVTEYVPSWWHGWSPDGKRLAYTAQRDGQFAIATIPVDGGAEEIVIGSPHHYDGPDYTPDGAWIWFNSDRGGSMQLWRIRPDGTEPEAMTAESTVNWFPHPAPDGRQVLYLAYPPGTEGHPRDRNVELRLLDIETRKTRRLLALFGGQGTINVPPWSPDGRRFAFMRYSRATE